MNIVILNPYNKFPGSSRWDFELINYEEFIDHEKHSVTYIADQRGLSGITAEKGLYRLVEIANFNDAQLLRDVLEQQITQLGKVDSIIAFSEGHMDLVAQIREEYNIDGPGVAETSRARDKIIMKQCVQGAGLRAPEYRHVMQGTNLEQIKDFVEQIGYPLILKPTDGASSVGVKKILNEQDLIEGLSQVDGDNWEVEEYVEGRIVHVDGLIDADGEVIFSIPSLYINTLFDYLHGAPTGSYLIPRNEPLFDNANDFARDCLKSLNFSSCPFHLELIVKNDGELVFLENAARVAGADIPYMIADCTQVNLFESWVKMLMGETLTLPSVEHKAGGWLLFGLPEKLPCEVADVTSFKGNVATLSKELVPEVGSVVSKGRGYCSLQAGRFVFVDEQFNKVMDDISHVLTNFKFSSQEVSLA